MKAMIRRPSAPSRWLVLLTAMLLLGGCSSGPLVLNMKVAGTSNLNSTDDSPEGKAAIVKIYQLSNDTNFRSVTLETFWQDERNALGNEVVSSRQFRLYPNTDTTLRIEPAEMTRFIGVAANLRQPDHEAWRQVYALSQLEDKQIRVQVSKDRVAINIQ